MSFSLTISRIAAPSHTSWSCDPAHPEPLDSNGKLAPLCCGFFLSVSALVCKGLWAFDAETTTEDFSFLPFAMCWSRHRVGHWRARNLA